MKNKERLGFVEWMQHINHTNQSPSAIARGLDRLLTSEPTKLPKGIKQ